MISWATRLASLTGMEKPTSMFPDWAEEEDVAPADAMATLTPITSPLVFSRGPPEFPGLMAASVWMTLMLMDPCAVLEDSACEPDATEDEVSMVRFAAETMPSVTVPPNPSGAPVANGGVTDFDACGVAQRGRDQSRGRDLDDGQVRERIRSDGYPRIDLAVAGPNLDGRVCGLSVQGDHMCVGQNMAGSIQNAARPGAAGGAGAGADRHHTGRGLLRSRCHRVDAVGIVDDHGRVLGCLKGAGADMLHIGVRPAAKAPPRAPAPTRQATNTPAPTRLRAFGPATPAGAMARALPASGPAPGPRSCGCVLDGRAGVAASAAALPLLPRLR